MRVLANLFIVLGILIFSTTGCTERRSSNPPDVPAVELTERVAILMGGHPHAKAVTQTGKATAYRITYPAGTPEKEQLGPGVALTPEQRSALTELLVRDDAYDWDIAKGCEPMPGVLITFEDGATFARVRLCFNCEMIGFRPGDWGNFDPINAELVQWVKGVFPDDPAIQHLGTDKQEHGL